MFRLRYYQSWRVFFSIDDDFVAVKLYRAFTSEDDVDKWIIIGNQRLAESHLFLLIYISYHLSIPRCTPDKASCVYNFMHGCFTCVTALFRKKAMDVSWGHCTLFTESSSNIRDVRVRDGLKRWQTVITYFNLLVTFDDILYCILGNVDTIVCKFSNHCMDWPSHSIISREPYNNSESNTLIRRWI